MPKNLICSLFGCTPIERRIGNKDCKAEIIDVVCKRCLWLFKSITIDNESKEVHEGKFCTINEYLNDSYGVKNEHNKRANISC